MLKERAREITYMVIFTDMLLLAISFLFAFSFRAYLLPGWSEGFKPVTLDAYIWLLFVSGPLFYIQFKIFHLYDSIRTLSYAGILANILKPFLLSGLILGSLIFIIKDKTFSRVIFFGFLCCYFLLVVVEKWTIKVFQKSVRKKGFNFRNVLIVGVGGEAVSLARVLRSQDHLGLKVLGHLRFNGEASSLESKGEILGEMKDLKSILDNRVVDEVLFAVPPRNFLELEKYIWMCEEVGVCVHLKMDFIRSLLSRTYISDLDGVPILTFTSTPHMAGKILLKRSLDIVSSSLGIVVLSLVMVIISILIKVTSPGPVFFRQIRSGLNGRHFTLFKFRSMYCDAEKRLLELKELNEMSGPVFKIRKDPRITPLGRYLRKFSLDELPQLWNVLRGDMSIVGPRPPLPDEVEQYQRWQRRRLSMKPGITCLWQINGRNEVNFEEWMKMDMDYIDNWSLTLDFKIVCRTFSAVLLTRGAR